ncbi:MAG: hypothetical protein ACT4PL_11040, partial [Phycisphaerales bacterium]
PAAQTAQPAAPQPVKLEDLPPPMRLGVRAELTRRQIPVMPMVVVVPDASSLVEVVGAWSLAGAGRFPVLIDDGRVETREDIARFIRAFAPARVVRWRAPGEQAEWPKDEPAQRARVEAALRSAWKPARAEPGGNISAMYAGVNHVPPGVVALSMADVAWPAGLALAAGRGQVLAWVTPPTGGGDAGGTLTLAQADDLSAQITRACEVSGAAWRGLGEGIDAVTLCLNVPVKVNIPAGSNVRGAGAFVVKPGEPIATSDLVGRSVDDRADRYAWCGQVFGTPARAVYSAMCGLFVQPRSAWVFDGYQPGQPWDLFDGTEAGELLGKGGLKVMVNDGSASSADAFRARAAGGWDPKQGRATAPAELSGGLNAGFIAVNTSGMTESFDLRPGQCVSGDVPILNVPSLVYFVHSWSANSPSNPSTVAGRWLAQGAYAYVGSVHEPFLQAFQPTPMFVRRLMAPAALGAAARLDGGPPWKIAVIGDPLITLGPAAPAPPATTALPLEGAEDLKDTVARALKAGDFESACVDLVLSGREGDALRLGRAMIRDRKDALTPASATHLAWCAFRAVDGPAFAQFYEAARATEDQHPRLRDGLWQAFMASGATLSRGQIDLLKALPRQDSTLRDAADLSSLLRRVSGPEGARAYLRELALGQKNEHVKARLEEMARGVK